FVALRHPDECPMNEGRLVSSRGLDITAEEYTNHFEEYQVPHSNALHSRRRGQITGEFFAGPLARWNLNADRAPTIVRQSAYDTGIPFPNQNPFVSIVARALEVLLAFDEALRLIELYEPPAKPAVDLPARAGIGEAITEAPRGILYHRYEIDVA